MRSKTPVILLLILLNTSVAMAQETPDTMNLRETLEYALDNNVDILNSELDADKAEHQIGEVRSSALPQINGSGELQYYPNLPTQLLPGAIVGEPGTQIPVQFGTEFNLNAGFNASQKLYDQELFTGLRAARNSRELHGLINIRTREDVIYEVSRAFYNVLEIRAQIRVLSNNMERLNQLTDLTRMQYSNELVTETELKRVKVNKANLSTQLQSARTAEKHQINFLKLLLGMSMNQQLTLKEPSNFEDLSLSTLQKEEQRRIEMQILNKEKELRLLDQKSISAGYFPKLSAFAQQTWQGQRNEFNFLTEDDPWFQQTLVGVQLEVPIFDGLRKHHQTQQKKIEIEKLDYEIAQTERSLEMQSENAREQLKNTLASVKAQRENKQLAQEVYDETQLRYKEQVSNLTELLDAESAYREAQSNYYREIVKFKLAELDLLKAKGRLTELIN